MKRALFLFVGCLTWLVVALGVVLHAHHATPEAKAGPEPAPKLVPNAANSKIAHVTVYPDSALVTRVVDVRRQWGV